MTFTEKIVVAKIYAKVKHSGKVIKLIYYMKSSVVALFSVNLMYSVNHMSVKVVLHCTFVNMHILFKYIYESFEMYLKTCTAKSSIQCRPHPFGK